MSEGGFVVSLFPSAKLRVFSVKGQRVSWKAVNLHHAFVLQAASCRQTGWGKFKVLWVTVLHVT